MSEGSSPLRVAIADNSSLFREGLAMQLHAAGASVLTQHATADALLAWLATRPAGLLPDLVLMDIRMPPTETDEGIRAASVVRRRYPRVGVLILSTYAESTYAAAVSEISPERIGYLLKDRVSDVSALLEALERIAAGGCVIDPDVIATLIRQRRLDKLTDRERAVLGLMAEGRSNTAIAEGLSVTVRTVEAYTAAIFAKLRLSDDAGTNRRVAAVIAWLRGSHSVV